MREVFGSAEQRCSFHNVLAADPAALDVVHTHVRDFMRLSLYPVMAI
jgi:hypothetical protein